MRKVVKREAAPTIGLVSLGCAKNAVDLQVMAGYLLAAGFELAPDANEADVLLVNTCAFIEAAREEATMEIMRACDLKAQGACRAVVVSGCFAQRYGEKLVDLFPTVDAWVGIDSLDRIGAIVQQALANTDEIVYDVEPAVPCRVFNPPVPALRFTSSAFAYLKIAEGCAHACAYCAIPGIRGKYRSRPVKAVVDEAKELLASGVKELNVIAQDPMLYGVDLKPSGRTKTNLVSLLKKLDKLDGDFWIRVLYSYPSEITEEYLEWLNTSPHAVKYVDVPLQHTDPAILKAMRRGSAVKASLEAATRLRAAVPGVTLRTTVMTGFPGETPESFARLLADVKTMQFDHLGAFAFSPEEGTVAAKLPDCPPLKEAQRREKKVMAAQRRVWDEKAKTFVGQTQRALVVDEGIARLASQAPDVDGVVYLTKKGRKPFPTVGTFIDVTITAVREFDFEATYA